MVRVVTYLSFLLIFAFTSCNDKTEVKPIPIGSKTAPLHSFFWSGRADTVLIFNDEGLLSEMHYLKGAGPGEPGCCRTIMGPSMTTTFVMVPREKNGSVEHYISTDSGMTWAPGEDYIDGQIVYDFREHPESWID